MNLIVKKQILILDKESKLRSNSVVIQFFAYGVGSVCLNIAMYLIPNFNYHMIAILVMCWATGLPMILLVLDGPSYLYKKGEISQMVSTMSSIATINSSEVKTKKGIYQKIFDVDE